MTTGPTDRRRPWIVMVTGEPGSGKTTLGLRLSAELRVPFLSRDHVRGGLLATAGLWTNELGDQPPPREAAVDAFVDILETHAEVGVSTVVEFVVTPARVEAFGRLTLAANVLVVLTTAADAPDRADRRDRNDPLLTRPDVLAALGLEAIEDYVARPERERIRTQMQTEFDDHHLPVLRVATDDGYDPPLPAIVDWIIERTQARRLPPQR